MTFDSEDAIKEELGLDSWRNLSKDKVMRFAAMMPDMDTEVAVRVIEQFPQFKAFALDALSVLEREHESSLKANTHSQEAVHQAFQDTRDIIRGQLDKGDPTPEERRHLIECLMEIAKLESAMDTENKKFIDGLLGKVLTGVGFATAAAVLVLGGRYIAEQKDGPVNGA
ncbi:hypothetical protein [Isoptericola sp. NPDC055881]